ASQVAKDSRLPGSTGAGTSRFAREPHTGLIALATSELPKEPQPSPKTRNKLVQRLLAAGSDLPTFVSDLITTQAIVVAGTEAAAFLLEASTEPGSVQLKPIAHIRPDFSTAEVRQQALAAFQEIVAPCLEQDKNGAIMIEGTDREGDDPQFCLVTL